MKPETPTPNIRPEQPSAGHIERVEATPDFEAPKSNNENSTSAERYEQSAEARAMLSDVGLSSAIPTPVSAPSQGIGAPPLNDVSNTSNPVTANDEDLIEKEWVDRAKSIVNQTKNDPHRRDEEVTKLKVDYLKKRYGRELGAQS